jgi:probable phosphoglycerate mutase
MAETLTVIYLVRHGQSEWNHLRLTQGQIAHPKLTALGRRQAADAASTLVSRLGGRPACIASSDAVRALETARIIAAETEHPVRVDARLREQALGSFEGLRLEESAALAATLDFTDPDLHIGGGESVRDVRTRMLAALRDARRSPADSILVSHGDAIRILLHDCSWSGRADGAPPMLPNGGVIALDDMGVPEITRDAPGG